MHSKNKSIFLEIPEHQKKLERMTPTRQAVAYVNSALKYVCFENINKFSRKKESMENDQTFIATLQTQTTE
jgi:hypothetical protein